MRSKKIKIKNIKELLSNIRAGRHDYYILLAGGAARSSKHIRYNETLKKFSVYNLVDGSQQLLSAGELDEKELSNIGEAIKKGCLIMEITL